MKKRISGLLVIVLALFAVVLAGCQKNGGKEDRAEADIDWQMIAPKKMKTVLEQDDPADYQIIDIQPKADYKKGHLPHSISVPAYPVDTEELEKLVVDNADQFKEGENPIYVVCPGGGSGAKRTISLLIDEGVDKSRLFIVENGAKKWPYKDDKKLWVTD
ncbi:rhodanese-like domain-containing protein [Enterococcus dongliensis]|uniref:Rhodanese-like domain-containing protein n=1 Tax=Enterococcus dongliensis TaxID=2559925 RepID=A0AAW8TR12_9ENTE|nr:rhodanese-like domain-containing protein [Enterococcus dongliensis]MDT2604848.1 rhodanese-like domain-containing protein [Enterococcus dongliensis]MDT2613640.1 rhodanese-like domain-containing protein [Enterococcus dongliensis]MDT2635805.1 rhodanese-like domain-containing protein [Enterococcus dongliensis]MDT2638485.1 rhodanese-like domain-containing protein [Enterococcus dongliensis]MDT2640984.1 rhodanese-like domain-containing protein [Enterococcus dongliensis]